MPWAESSTESADEKWFSKLGFAPGTPQIPATEEEWGRGEFYERIPPIGVQVFVG